MLVNSNFRASGSSNQGVGDNFSLSSSGRWIAFESLASDVVDASDDHFRDIYLRDLEQKTRSRYRRMRDIQFQFRFFLSRDQSGWAIRFLHQRLF